MKTIAKYSSVVIVFKGRLGNQLFQYATGLFLASRNGGKLNFKTAPWDNPEILQLVSLDPAPESLLKKTSGDISFWGRIYRQFQIFLPGRVRTFFVQKNNRLFPAVLSSRRSVYLDGYWQSFRYFEALDRRIFAPMLFRLGELAGDDPLGFLVETKVVIHVRRGDYGGDFPLLGLDYYKRAMTQFPGEQFLVVSDDPELCKEFFKGCPGVEVADQPNRTLWQDLNLMVRAKGVIIANSTFSWWGAYLNPRKDKKIVAPSIWFGRNPNLKDIYPADWLVL